MSEDVYIYVKPVGRNAVAKTVEAAPGVNIDYDVNGDVIGVEVLNSIRGCLANGRPLVVL